jgi:thiol-disulfide isomerase/thioredoxin
MCCAPAALAQSLDGRWDAAIRSNDFEIPFRIDFSGSGDSVQGWFFNGQERVPSTGGRFENGVLTLRFDHYASQLKATLKNGQLEGEYGAAGRTPYAFTARPHAATRTASGAPDISGLWELGVKSPKGESAWRLIVRQSGPEVSAAILRVDGDTGTLTGAYRDGHFDLSHFSGARPARLLLTPAGGDTLALELITPRGRSSLTATRPAQARAQGLPEPADPNHVTSIKDPSEPFRFALPDLNGRIVSSADPRFRGKVVIVAISGSWCPNCHDEAPFLEELYRRYRSQGLEVVMLSFEEADQLRDPARLRAFIRQYGIEYTVLLGGEPSELAAKLPQAVNLNSWPTTFFLGRDGQVRAAHAGFPGSASYEFHTRTKQETAELVEHLLAENKLTER